MQRKILSSDLYFHNKTTKKYINFNYFFYKREKNVENTQFKPDKTAAVFYKQYNPKQKQIDWEEWLLKDS